MVENPRLELEIQACKASVIPISPIPHGGGGRIEAPSKIVVK